MDGTKQDATENGSGDTHDFLGDHTYPQVIYRVRKSHLLGQYEGESELPQPEVPPVPCEIEEVYAKLAVGGTRGAQAVFFPRRSLLPAVEISRDNPRHGVPENGEPLAAVGPLARA